MRVLNAAADDLNGRLTKAQTASKPLADMFRLALEELEVPKTAVHLPFQQNGLTSLLIQLNSVDSSAATKARLSVALKAADRLRSLRAEASDSLDLQTLRESVAQVQSLTNDQTGLGYWVRKSYF